MPGPSRDRVTIDLRGIGDAVRAAAACRGMGVAQLVRRAVVMSLDLHAPATVAPMKQGSDGQTPDQVPTRETAKLTLAVNVSAVQWAQADYVPRVLSRVYAAGIDPSRLKLELTESVVVGDLVELTEKMKALKAHGIGFSLDDFGTGYSSLAYLSRLPLDQLKIDRSFVTNIELGDNNMVICAATISLAHSLRLKVVAEGVEDNAQRYFLSTVHRCDLLQGYLYSRPVPHQAFEKLVATWRAR